MEAKLAGINLTANDRKCDARSGIRRHRNPVRSLTRCNLRHELLMSVKGDVRSNYLCSMFTPVNAPMTQR
jgi:hypothetical protein